MASARSLDGLCYNQPGEPPPLSQLAGSGVVRAQQLIAGRAGGVAVLPGYDLASGGLVGCADLPSTALGSKHSATVVASGADTCKVIPLSSSVDLSCTEPAAIWAGKSHEGLELSSVSIKKFKVAAVLTSAIQLDAAWTSMQSKRITRCKHGAASLLVDQATDSFMIIYVQRVWH